MFQTTTENSEEEKSFSDAYRSEILNYAKTPEEEPIAKKLILILLLIIIISFISILSYKYLVDNHKNNTNSIEEENIVHEIIEKKEIIVPKKIEEVEEISISEDTLPTESMMIDNVEDLEIIEPAPTLEITHIPSSKNSDIDEIANQMKLEISKELDKKRYSEEEKPKSIEIAPETQTEPLPIAPSEQMGEDEYMKELAELSKEIDGQ